MKKTVLLLAAAMFAAGTMAFAQNVQALVDDVPAGANPEFIRLIKEDLTRASVNMNSYEFPDYDYSPVPRGYKPVYISVYARHGSRSNWGDKDYKKVIEKLQAAKDEGILTASGDSLLSETRFVLEHYDGMDGRLSPRGVREHKRLAERMYARNPQIFRKGSKKVRVEVSTVQRCIISMASFTNSLTALQPDLQYSFDTGEKFMEYINNDAGKEHRADVKRRVDSLLSATLVDTTSILGHLFTDTVKGREIVGNVEDFEKSIWYTACIAEDFDCPTVVFRHLPFSVIYKYFDNVNRIMYYRQCNSIEHGDERMRYAEPLVRNVFDYADQALADGSVCADLKFGHDYPLLSLASFIGIENIGQRLNFDEISRKWFGPQLICMASNLQMVFYRNRAGHVLVKFLYNEKESRLIGLEPEVGDYYYDWEKVRAAVMSRFSEQ